jgi:hypothetical protein
MGLAHKGELQGCAHQKGLEPCEPDMVPYRVFVVLAADQHCSTNLVGGIVCSYSARVVKSVHPYEQQEPTK